MLQHKERKFDGYYSSLYLNGDGSFNRDAFISACNEIDGVDVLYNNNGIILIEIINFESCRELLSYSKMNWCIVTNRNYWYAYVTKDKANQFFYFNFNKMPNPASYIGFTVNKGIIVAAHDKNDLNLLPNDYFHKIMLNNGINDIVKRICRRTITKYIKNIFLKMMKKFLF